ncbi:uncharacterized protein LOC143916786 [Arctopsyche grandis]|uniref:uncharacterized protein LOC143916786 n=1 Tax=Arctopsyche grandis TaxID=121162 RepID=UPI00406D7AAC
MKNIVIILFLSCIFAGINAYPRKLNSNVRLEPGVSGPMQDVLEKLRNLIHNGNETLGIPVLDPLIIPSIDINLNTSALKVNLEAEGISLTGIGDFDVSNIDITLLPMGLRFEGSFPLTKLVAEKYDLVGKIAVLPIYGAGNVLFEVGALKFKGNARIAVGISGVSLRDLILELSLGSFKSETTGMLGGGDIDQVINAILADWVPDFFNSNSDSIADLVGDTLLTSINQVLDGMSLADLIDLVTGGS